MNTSLVILLILLLSTCHGKEQDTPRPSDILPTTEWQKEIVTPEEDLCPEPTDIEPCECTIEGMPSMSCSNVQDEEELRRVFSAFFPTTEFYEFEMHGNDGVKVLEDGVFGNVNFHFLNIRNTVLETVKMSALTPSLSRVTYFWIMDSHLEIFPLERLMEFTSLHDLLLSGNKIHTVPPLSSSSLRSLSLGDNLITHITPDVFTLLPSVQKIYLYDNDLTEISKGTFTGLPDLTVISLYRNDISYLQSLTFDLDSTLSTLFLNSNSIDEVEADAFKGVAVSGTINMDYNALTRLREEVWRSVLEKNITVELEGNVLACGCDVAWLVRDFHLLTTVINARCADGTLLMDLSPADFDICG